MHQRKADQRHVTRHKFPTPETRNGMTAEFRLPSSRNVESAATSSGPEPQLFEVASTRFRRRDGDLLSVAWRRFGRLFPRFSLLSVIMVVLVRMIVVVLD